MNLEIDVLFLGLHNEDAVGMVRSLNKRAGSRSKLSCIHTLFQSKLQILLMDRLWQAADRTA